MQLNDNLKKPVEAIQCANTFSLLQRKMYNVLLANAANHLKPDVTHRIGLGTLCKFMHYNSKDYDLIKQKFRELRRMDIEWDIINENGNKVWTNTSPLSLARIIEGEGICEYEFTPSIVPYLDRPARYAKFSLTVMSKFKSNYGLALYENCERYKKIGYTKYMDISIFRKLMGVGVDEYTEFSDLKRRVIDKAISEVNQYADFHVEPEYIRNGKKVASLRFTIIKNENTILIDEDNTFQSVLEEKLKQYFNCTPIEISNYITTYGTEYLDEKVCVILNSDSFKNGTIRNMQSYLKSALKDNYKPSVSSKDVVAVQRQAQQEKETENFEKRMVIVNAYQNYCYTKIREMLNSMDSERCARILSTFEKSLGNSAALNIFKRDGLNDKFIMEELFKFLKFKYPEVNDCLMNFQEFEATYKS